MTIVTILVVVALLLTVGILVTGIGAMAHGGEFDRKHSDQLMYLRVGMQGVTLLLVLVAIYFAAQG